MFTMETKFKPWLGDVGRNFKIVLRQPSLRSFGRGIKVESSGGSRGVSTVSIETPFELA